MWPSNSPKLANSIGCRRRSTIRGFVHSQWFHWVIRFLCRRWKHWIPPLLRRGLRWWQRLVAKSIGIDGPQGLFCSLVIVNGPILLVNSPISNAVIEFLHSLQLNLLGNFALFALELVNGATQ